MKKIFFLSALLCASLTLCALSPKAMAHKSVRTNKIGGGIEAKMAKVAAAAEDYAAVYTSNITLEVAGENAYDATVIVNNKEYKGVKLGTSSKVGVWEQTFPAGTEQIHLHIAGWNKENVTLSVEGAGLDTELTLTTNSGISNNTPYTFSGDPSTDDYFFTLSLTEPLSDDATITFTATNGFRFVVFGVNVEGENLVLEPTEVVIDGLVYADAYYYYDKDWDGYYWDFDLYKDIDWDNLEYIYPEVYLMTAEEAKSKTAINGEYTLTYASYASDADTELETDEEAEEVGTLTIKNVDNNGNYSFSFSFVIDGTTYTSDCVVDVWAYDYDNDEDIELDENKTAISSVEDATRQMTLKVVQPNGEVLILHGERVYNVQGQQMK